MANIISDETMEYVGILAKLELSDAEKGCPTPKRKRRSATWDGCWIISIN